MESDGIIRKLPQEAIAKIAAGEVVVRPSYVIKELVENSIDAGSTEIRIVLHPNPLDFGEVNDNGCGVSPQDLHVICQRFTTSKNNGDIAGVQSYGFRGEALAALSQSSYVSISSRRACDSNRVEINYVNGAPLIDKIKNLEGPVGFTINYRKLFYCMQTRFKALSSSAGVEFGLCLSVVQKYALQFPNIKFSVEKSGSSSLVLSTSGLEDSLSNCDYDEEYFSNKIDLSEYKSSVTKYARMQLSKVLGVIREMHGGRLANSLYQFTSYKLQDDLQYSAKGLFSHPLVPTRMHEIVIFINNRLVKHRSLQKSIDSVYSDSLPKGQRRFVYISLFVPYNIIDANVHPTKERVTLVNEDYIVECILSDFRSALDGIKNVVEEKPVCTILSQDTVSDTVNRAVAPTVTGTTLHAEPIRIATATTNANVADNSNKVPVHKKVRIDYRQMDIERFVATHGETKKTDNQSKPKLEKIKEYSYMETMGSEIDLSGAWSSQLVSSLIADVTKGDPDNAKPILCSVLVGALDKRLVLLQHETDLILVDIPKVSQEFGIKNRIHETNSTSGNMDSNPSEMEMNRKLYPDDSMTLASKIDSFCKTRDNMQLASNSAEKLMNDFPVQVLERLFSFVISDSMIHAMPQVLSNYFPGIEYLSQLMLAIYSIQDRDLKQLTSKIARLVAKFYTLPPYNNSIDPSQFNTRVLLPAIQRFPDLILEPRYGTCKENYI
ncbi:bifunctional DNA mismatch repair protein MutL-Mlh-Pms/DNA mismatch repair protein Mlh1 [Babesia duncani]|uniref:Bifunctional DNA mismatch repair protein MutL-Mlh-Pms/DNA mismatch repair protein Mlh1 n=1 Tax=Babesia duncani TaxID=323732 RepID=A0AAD9PJH0_9APIC|nr:bifunctional DNA mismatch repair protein MutL-Mlh-Pms/DNA mismatch repair protein Mlh1 [Babesia duncani]